MIDIRINTCTHETMKKFDEYYANLLQVYGHKLIKTEKILYSVFASINRNC